MKAIVQTAFGSADVLRLTDLPKPVPTDDEVLIRIYAASVNGSDREGLIGKPLYARLGGPSERRPRILGSDIAGRVESVGRNIRDLQPGDDVFGEIPGYRGGFAEYACATEATLVRKPVGLGFAEAAAIPQGGVIAFRGICVEGNVQPGQKVLVNGAAGAAGSFAVQLARLRGAEVTGVDHTDKLDFLRSLGADHVVDYTREDFTRTGQRYHLILDVIAHRSVFAYARALLPGGTCLVVGGAVNVLIQCLLLGGLIRKVTSKRIRVLMVPQNREDLASISELCSAGKVVPPIDRTYPLHDVPDALRYVSEGRQKGKVVIAVAADSDT